MLARLLAFLAERVASAGGVRQCFGLRRTIVIPQESWGFGRFRTLNHFPPLDLGSLGLPSVLVKLEHEGKSITVIATLHDLTLASRYPDRLIMLVDGRVVAEGSPVEVLTESHLARFYGASVTVLCTADGLAILPRRPFQEPHHD